MPFYFFLWTDDNIEHLADHGVSQEEFETVACDPESVEVSRSSGRMIAFGTINGRDLACVYETIDDMTVLPITGYEV